MVGKLNPKALSPSWHPSPPSQQLDRGNTLKMDFISHLPREGLESHLAETEAE